MVNSRDLAVTALVALGALAVFIGVGGIGLVGSSSIGICDIPVVSQFSSSCGTEVAQKYDVSTTVAIQATEQKAFLSESSFDYTTTKSGIGLSFLSPDTNLAFGGVEDAILNFNLLKDGEVIADGNKYVGEMGILAREKVSFDVNNVEQGRYTVKYELRYDPGFGGVRQTETLEENIRVPKVIE